jgi:GNAT superfamily N-acetyltransferase
MSYRITFEPSLSKEDEETIFGGLLTHASLETGLPIEVVRAKSHGFVVRIEGQIRAGLIVTIFCDAALMDTLWVDQSLRRKGIGLKLLQEAETFAKTKGCTTAYLNTLSPDNLKFYEKAGYVFEFARRKYLGEFDLHYFRKEL